MQKIPLIINGESVFTKTTFSVVNPLTSSEIWTACSASVKDAREAVEAAQTSFRSWSKTKPSVRRDIFLRAADIFDRRRDELANLMKNETGAEDKFIDFNVTATAEQLRDLAGRISGIQGYFPTAETEGRSAIIIKEPYGVILGIAPWNAPYILGCRAFSYAIAAGNTVVLKGSELAPGCFKALVDIFQEAGLPKGVLNLLFTQPSDAAEVTSTLIAHPAVGKVNFTGSTTVGSAIASVAGKHLKPVLMELGGKATSVVLGDADLHKAALGCTLGAFMHAGQVCMGTERIAVHASILKPFTEALTQTIDAVYGSKGQTPNLVSSSSRIRVQKLVDNAVNMGAKALYGLNEDQMLPQQNSQFHPVVLTNIKSEMDLHYSESFGPVVSIYTFDTEEEALRIANDTEYGLAGAIFTQDLAAGLRIARQYTTGAVHINSMSIHDEASLPHGGVKKSGFGRFNGSQGLNEFLRTKVVTWED